MGIAIKYHKPPDLTPKRPPGSRPGVANAIPSDLPTGSPSPSEILCGEAARVRKTGIYIPSHSPQNGDPNPSPFLPATDSPFAKFYATLP